MKLNTYTPEFRAEAVKLVLAQGLTLEEAAQRIAMPKGTLGNWVSAAKRGDGKAAVYCATKFAVRALSEGLRQESQFLRVTVVSPGLTRTELFDTRSAQTRAMVEQLAISPQAIADAIAFAIDQPSNVDVNELIIRPTLQGT